MIACGVWSPKLARMAGAAIPLTPAVHQMISVGPIPQLAERPGEISFPIVRDMDTFCYERQHGADMEVGSYAHRPILWDPEDIPSIEQAKLSPTELPFTADDFDPQLEQALELMPDALGADGAEIRYAINGLLSLTPDGAPILGETPEVKGLWSAAAVWVKEGPGVGRAVAEWMTHGHSEIDVSHSDIARFYPHQRTRAHIRSRTDESFNKTYGIVHPAEQWAHERGKRLAPMYAAEKAAGAEFFETVGWERPMWYRSNEALLGEYGEAVMPRAHEWDARWWSPIINAEHLAMRERAGIVDLSAFAIFDIVGPAAAQAVQGVVVAQADVADGRVVYTPVLDAKGGFRSDLTVMRLGHDRYRVVTGGLHGMADLKWFADHRRCVRVLGALASSTRPRRSPRSGSGAARRATSSAASPTTTFRTAASRSSRAGPSRSAASRCSPRGSPTSESSGWELYVPMEQGAPCGDCCTRRGGPTARSRSASASTARRGGSRRATGLSVSSSTASGRSSRPGWPGRGSRTPTSSAGTPTSRSGPRRRRRCCAR